jgi:CRISPR/Cas system-associated exonuclease Cas4 (RecB family)
LKKEKKYGENQEKTRILNENTTKIIERKFMRRLSNSAIFSIQYIMQNRKYLARNDRMIMIYREKYEKNIRITP